MALSGTLQNFAGGVMILLFRPFKVGDYIAASGNEGFVKEIQIFNTVLTTPDNKLIVIPNSQLATNSLTNYTRMEHRRVDVNVGIAYGESVDKAREVILEIAQNHPLTLAAPEGPDNPVVVLTQLGASSVDLQLRVWVKPADYWTVLFDMNQQIYEAFNAKGIEIPFNQLQVHIDKN